MDYALKRLKTFKYVPMWYFTREGLYKAVRTMCQPNEKNEMLAIVQALKGNITVQAAITLAVSNNAKLDHQLSYGEYTVAQKTVQMFAQFVLNAMCSNNH
ncbi:hypothetical protein ID866_9822 [Astraeus odoratus]|nr:hypothetical protein ID866_9822 [Astraeus odoratus]